MTTEAAAVGVRSFGETPAGRRVDCWRLERDDVLVEVLTYGARLHALHVPGRDRVIDDVVVGPDGLPGHLANEFPFAGGVVGRFANRLGGGRVSVGGEVHELATNEGTTTLHGGPAGFDQRLWEAEEASDARGPAVRLHLHSADGDNGFPGELDVSATYRLLDDRTLSLDLEASTDAPTVVNLTNHAYWDLGGGSGVGGHNLRVPAERYVEVDGQLLPVAVRRVAGTPFDLRGGRLLEEVIDVVDIDHCYLLNGDIAAVLSHAGAGRRLTISSNQPAVQVYLGGQLPQPHAALAIEPQVAPNAPNRPDLRLGPDGLLTPHETYVHQLTWRFEVD